MIKVSETNIDFIGKRFFAFALSMVLIIGSIGLIVSKGLNFGIDFTGGTMIEVRIDGEEAPDLGEMRKNLNALDLGSISIQEFGAPNDLLIRLAEQGEGDAAIAKVKETLSANYENIDYRRVERVGPQVGEELKQQGLYAVLFSMIGMLIYIWFRFEWQFSIAAIGALLHDSIITIGLFAFTQMEFNLSTVAAILMIAGYSINDTVVIFDRIRENLRKFKKMYIFELLNKSVNQTLSRTMMTSITTLLALVALWVFGGEVIRGFVDALIFGIVIGTYSSIFVASPLLTFFNMRRSSKGPSEEEQAKDEEKTA